MGDSNYQLRRHFADRFNDRLLSLIGILFNVNLHDLRLSTLTEDRDDGVDVYIIPHNVAIGLRVRRAHASRYNDLTLREVKNPHGLTEVDKIKLGRINYMMIGYATDEASSTNSTSDDLDRWLLVDLGPVKAAAQNGWAEVFKQYHSGDNYNFVALDLESLADTYGPVVVASGTSIGVHPDFAARWRLTA